MYVCEGGNTALPGVKKRNESSVGSFLTPVYIFSTVIKGIVNVQAGYVAFNHKLNPG